MKYTTTRTAPGAQLAGQLFVNELQQSKKLGVLQEGMAHWAGLYSSQMRDSPKGHVCSSSPRGILPSTSRYLTACAPNTIKIGDRAQY